MANDNQNWRQTPPPANLPSMPPERSAPMSPPPPEITLRTMKSDAENLRESGGANPVPKPFTPPEFKRSAAGAPPPPKITPSEFGLPRSETKPLPTASAGIAAAPSPIIEEESRKKPLKSKKGLWASVITGAIVVGLAGYFIILPRFFPPETPSSSQINVPATEVPIGTVESSAASAPMELKPHISLLRFSDTSAQILLETTDQISLAGALKKEAEKTLPANTLTEIILSDTDGQISSATALPALLPELTPDTVAGLFDDDFTTTLYYDASGVWPAYILKLKPGINIVDARAVTEELEKSSSLSNLFLAPPGVADASGFKTGSANNFPARYLTFSNQGTAIDFVWLNDKFIISTSYNGLKRLLNSF